MASFVLYSLVILITYLLAYSLSNLRNGLVSRIVVSFIVSIPMLILLGSRVGIGTDYANYEIIYELARIQDDFFHNPLEVGFVYMVDIMTKMNYSYRIFIQFTSLLTVFPVFLWASYRAPQNKSSFGFYITAILLLYFSIWFAAIRQNIALALVICASYQIEKRRFIPFLLLIATAGIFHLSSFIIIPLYFLYKKDKEIINNNYKFFASRTQVILLGLMAVVMVFMVYGNSLGFRYTTYLKSDEGGLTPYYFVFALPLYVVEIMYYKQVVRREPRLFFYYYFLIFEGLTFFLSMWISFAFRFGQYFSFAHVIILSSIYSVAYEKKKYLLKFYLVIMLLVQFYALTFLFKYNGIIPYQSILKL